MDSTNVKLTSYQIGNRIKSLLDEGADTKVILESIGIKRAQLTTYKKIINNGRLEVLRTNSVRKVLAEEKRSEKSKKLITSKMAEEPTAKQFQEKTSGNEMINEIEKIGQNDNEDINLEYFVGGQKKYYIKHHSHHSMSDNRSKEILMAENILLRMRLKNEMGKRIK